MKYIILLLQPLHKIQNSKHKYIALNRNYVVIGAISIFLLFSQTLFSAAFNSTDSMVNVPIAKQYRASELQFGFSSAYNGSSTIQGKSVPRYEIDFKTTFSINEKNQVALNLANPSTFVGHYQFTLTDTFSSNQVAVGLRNISPEPFSSWKKNQYVEDINMSPYIVNTFFTEKTIFSIGYGLRVFEHKTKSLQGISNFIENLNGIFFGFSYTEDIMTVSAEYDGRDINFGFKIQPTPYYEIQIGITEQFIKGDFNPQHNNAPKRQITFGISSKNIFSQHDYYNKKIKNLTLILAEYEKRELKRKTEQVKKIKVKLIKEDDVLKAKVAELFTESLERYNERNYEASIKLLHDAAKIDPTNYAIISRLGSVYYTYGFLDHATFYWRKAYKMNPNSVKSDEIKTFISEY